MASNLVFTTQEGGASLTLYGNEEAAIAAASNLALLSIAGGRKSPWEQLHYPGHGAIRAKFMGTRPIQYVVIGKVFSVSAVIATQETEIEAGLDQVLDLNRIKDHYTLTGVIFHRGEGVIVEDVTFEPLGQGTGPAWQFMISLKNLGSK